jgi:hypothetical protein
LPSYGTGTVKGVRCTSCNSRTAVLETVQRRDGATRRRRECTECGRRFTTEEWPDLREALGELPESNYESGGPLEAVRRRAIIAAAPDENERHLLEAYANLHELYEELRELLSGVLAREPKEEAKR